MSKEGSTKTLYFMTLGVLVLRCDHINHICEYELSSTYSIYIQQCTLIAIVLRYNNAAFLYHHWFHLFYDGYVGIQIWAPPTRSQCIKSLILRWPLRCVGLLIVFNVCPSCFFCHVATLCSKKFIFIFYLVISVCVL